MLEILVDLKPFIELSETVKKNAVLFNNSGIKSLDALHLASAIEAKANYFCTCDDKFIKKAKKLDTGMTIVVSPLELLKHIEK